MICPRCGRTIPDGTQCPCMTEAPILSSNPALNVIKTIGSSTMFLVFAILFSAGALFSIFSSMGADSTLNTMYYYAANSGVSPEVLYPLLDMVEGSSLFSSIAMAIPAILIAISLWLHYVTSKNRVSGGISTTGLTICKVLAYISLIAMCVMVVLALIGVILILVASASIYSGYAYDDNSAYMAAGIGVAIVFICIFVAIFLTLYIIYEVCVIKTINRIKATAMTGVPDNRIPRFLTVMNYIVAVVLAFSGLVSLFGAPVAGISTLLSAAGLIIITILLTQYRNQMSMLLYPPVQPVYAAPQPAQQYTAPQAPIYHNAQPPVQSAAPVMPNPPVQPVAAPAPVQAAPVIREEKPAPVEPVPERPENASPVETAPIAETSAEPVKPVEESPAAETEAAEKPSDEPQQSEE